MAAPLPASYRLYQVGTTLASPWIRRAETRRLIRKGVPQNRHGERFGKGYGPRPSGRVIWLNAVSLGETRIALMLARDLIEGADVHVLITTTTETAAALVAADPSDRVHHAFSPIDLGRAVAGFLDHWHPDLGIFVESELWPRLIVEAHRRDIPLALVNARLSKQSQSGWRRAPRLARMILSRLSLCLAQSQAMADAFTHFGASSDQVEVFGDFKALADPIPVEKDALSWFQSHFGPAPLWVAASTHTGEEEVALAAHEVIRATQPDARLILVPRHPERGPAIAEAARGAGFAASLRSAGETPDHPVLIADTLGELGLWYRLAPVALIGGSITQNGGHNPYEATGLGCFALTGPGIESFRDAYAQLSQDGLAEILDPASPDAIASAVSRRWAKPRLAVTTRPQDLRSVAVAKLLHLMEAA